ncbi:craniofacial development protein 2-like [Octopus sinensis]|uniref:Craniofacial development protein 2-like n=1 Tax=Octopus sinensis TaxID=2607531 RepID=A0A6P7SRA8_9MOLL|nr:craniofacial development protein 2-like [Octopus sinensis]
MSDRVITILIKAKPNNITLLQIYAPTAEAEEDEIEQFYAEIQGAIEETSRADAVVYILGDFNAKIGEMAEADIVGKFGLGERNEAGDRLVQFCQEQHMRLTNTWFRQPRRRLYTWTSPSGQYRNQIDNILCQQRWKSSVQAVKTFPGADCGSDHELLVAKIKMRLCSVKRPPAYQKFDTSKIGPSYAAEIRNRFELLAIEENQEAEEILEKVKEIVVETAEKHVLYKKPIRSAKWISEETIAIAEERRRAKMTRSRDEVRRLNAMFQQAARKDKEKYWNEGCARAEEAYRKGNMRELYQHVKKTRTVFMARQATIRGRNSEELHDQEGIRKIWKEYTE